MILMTAAHLANATEQQDSAATEPGQWNQFLVGIAITVTTAIVAGIARTIVRRVRQFRPGSESPWRRKYWSERVDERIQQAREWESPRTTRRVAAALAQLEASEAMRWSPRPGPGSSWALAALAYAGAIVLRVLAEHAWLNLGGAALLLVLGVCCQIDALTTPDRRRELQSVLARIAGSDQAGQELVAHDPQDVIAHWRQSRKTINRPDLSRPAATLKSWAHAWRPTRKMSRHIPLWAKHPWWSFKRTLDITDYTNAELAKVTRRAVEAHHKRNATP